MRCAASGELAPAQMKVVGISSGVAQVMLLEVDVLFAGVVASFTACTCDQPNYD